jgi:hypothetical protein
MFSEGAWDILKGHCGDSSEKSIHDISKIMEARKNLKQMYIKMLVPCLLVEALEVASLVYGILRGNFIPFVAVMALAIVCVAIVFNYWHRNIMYICQSATQHLSRKSVRHSLPGIRQKHAS